jgi:nucleotide-binding universal stress UspA family protein
VRTDLALFLETGQRAGLRPFGLVSHIRSGSAAREIAQLANDLQANLVVVGTQGRTGIARLLLGSVAHAVVTLAPCAVLVARDRSFALSVPARGRPGDLDGTETRVQVGSEGN